MLKTQNEYFVNSKKSPLSIFEISGEKVAVVRCRKDEVGLINQVPLRGISTCTDASSQFDYICTVIDDVGDAQLEQMLQLNLAVTKSKLYLNALEHPAKSEFDKAIINKYEAQYKNILSGSCNSLVNVIGIFLKTSCASCSDFFVMHYPRLFVFPHKDQMPFCNHIMVEGFLADIQQQNTEITVEASNERILNIVSAAARGVAAVVKRCRLINFPGIARISMVESAKSNERIESTKICCTTPKQVITSKLDFKYSVRNHPCLTDTTDTNVTFSEEMCKMQEEFSYVLIIALVNRFYSAAFKSDVAEITNSLIRAAAETEVPNWNNKKRSVLKPYYILLAKDKTAVPINSPIISPYKFIKKQWYLF